MSKHFRQLEFFFCRRLLFFFLFLTKRQSLFCFNGARKMESSSVSDADGEISMIMPESMFTHVSGINL